MDAHPLLPGETASSTSYKCRLIADHLISTLAEWKGVGRTGPLMVGMQGPQGSGKTTITRALVSTLRTQHDIRIQVLSLDDLYLTHDGLVELAAQNPTNGLLRGRGLPGTHDLALAEETLSRIQQINDPVRPPEGDDSSGTLDLTSAMPRRVELPIFDKSLFGGQGDRSSETVRVEGRLDIFILEGWSVGFQALSEEDMTERYQTARRKWDMPPEDPPPTGTRPHFLSHTLPCLLQINDLLHTASSTLYPPFTTFIQLTLSDLTHIHTWRLEQELSMSASNGGQGMDAEEVRRFVERYLPGYELWSGGVRGVGWAENWRGRGLGLVFGAGREVLGVERF